MANPTLKSNAQRVNMDNLGLECEQLIVNGVPVISDQQANVADTAAPAAYTAADISATYVEAEVQSVADALETLRDEVATLTTVLNSTLAILEAHGLMADA